MVSSMIINLDQEYSNYIHKMEDYIKCGEKPFEDYRLGIEVEHITVKNSDLSSVSYFDNKGINELLKTLADNGWNICEKDNGHILCLIKHKDEINLEPGGQIEFSFHPRHTIDEIKTAYINICMDIIPVLKEFDISLLNIGYHPKSTIADLPLLPKNRYRNMFEHFASRGHLAHNMMKGTASIQVSIDFSNETDFIKKLKVANWLSPIFYATFDNTPLFEGQFLKEKAIRSKIWYNCDNDRCGIIKEIFDKATYNYSDYANYILNLPAIYAPWASYIQTGESSFAEVLSANNIKDPGPSLCEHMLSFAFNDARAKQYIELRSADSLPFPLFLGYMALIKGLFYDSSNLDLLFQKLEYIDSNHISNTILKLPEYGIYTPYTENKTIKEWAEELFSFAGPSLKLKEDIAQLNILKDFLDKNIPIRNISHTRPANIRDLAYCNISDTLTYTLANVNP